jgi:hypothetical protein
MMAILLKISKEYCKKLYVGQILCSEQESPENSRLRGVPCVTMCTYRVVSVLVPHTFLPRNYTGKVI